MMAKGPAYAQTQAQKEEDPMLKILITSLSVTDRPDLIMKKRKSAKPTKPGKAVHSFSTAGLGNEDDGNRTASVSSASGDASVDEEDDEIMVDPTQVALPTLMMAGTIWGEVLRADLSKNKVDVETNNLRKYSFAAKS